MKPPDGSLPVLEHRKHQCFMCRMIARVLKDGELVDVETPDGQMVFPVRGQYNHLEDECAMDQSPEWQKVFRELYGEAAHGPA